MRDIVLLIQPAVAKVGEAALSVRTKFMIDTITDLKNNRAKAPASISSEHVARMRKILGSVSHNRVIKATEPLRISRTDIHSAEKKGKWWLVGASWKEDPLESARKEFAALPGDDMGPQDDLLNIARAHRMNTDVRRSIFVAIMSASDYQDAHVRLNNLHLKRTQVYEIPRVLIHCCMEEEAYNPYYTLISHRLCGEMGRRIKVSFMYALWNVFRRMREHGEGDANDDGEEDREEEEEIPMRAIVNLAKMYGSLVADRTLTLSFLKDVNFPYLGSKTKMFVELLIITVIQQSQKRVQRMKKGKHGEDGLDKKALMDVFLHTSEAPQVVTGLIFFIRKVVSQTDLVPEKEVKLVRWGCKVAVDALTIVANEAG